MSIKLVVHYKIVTTIQVRNSLSCKNTWRPSLAAYLVLLPTWLEVQNIVLGPERNIQQFSEKDSRKPIRIISKHSDVAVNMVHSYWEIHADLCRISCRNVLDFMRKCALNCSLDQGRSRMGADTFIIIIRTLPMFKILIILNIDMFL